MESMRLADVVAAAPVPANQADAPEPREGAESLLASVETGRERAEVVLASGRRYAMDSDAEGARLTIRSGKGLLLLCVLVTDRGPVLAFEGAELELRAARSLLLESDAITVRTKTLRTEVEGDVSERIGGGRHTHVHASDQLEAAVIQAQASHGPIELRAAGRVAIDAEHIGLNDDPCPVPFGWSEIGNDEQEDTIQ